ncbi:MAG: elongation factor G, partial [Ignavibacteriales bacterium]|nr:elongation factor G [Ignavibacteriales bacterium]
EYNSESIRNIALVGHGGSGKTSLAEAMLYTAGETTRIGSVPEKNTVSDYTPNEMERQFSISLSLLHAEWNNTKINIIDTPGYSDFIGEVQCGLRVADTAVMLLKSAEGVEVGSEINYRYVKERNLANAVVINKIDHERSAFSETVAKAKDRLNSGVVANTFPNNEGVNVDTVVDILKMKAYQYGAPGSKKVTEIDIPETAKATAAAYHTELIEKVAESSEELMNKYFEEGDLTEKEFMTGLVDQIAKGNLVPAFAVSSTKAVGINNFMDFINSYFPSPLVSPPVKARLKDASNQVEIPCKSTGEPVLFIFKTISEAHVGELSLFKVYSGTIQAGLDLLNEANGKGERLNQLSVLNGHNRKEIGKLYAGDLGAVVKLKDTHTNNTLASKNYSVILDEIKFPDSIINSAILPKSKGDEDKIANGLHTIHEEDPSFSHRFDPELSQTIISGQGEIHLDLAVKRLKERYGVDVELTEPKIPYREAIKGKCESVEYKHKKQSGGRGQFGHVFLRVEPLPRGAGFEFVNAIVGGVVPGRFIPAVEKGVQEVMAKGILSGCPIIDIKVTLHFGSYHPVDSDEMSFKIAGSMGFKKGFLEAKPCLLEPIYEIEVTIPEECMGDVMGDVSSRRGKILGMDSDGHFQIIKALVPLAELYKYSSSLRSLTGGRGAYKRKLSHYEDVPKEIESKIVDEYKKLREEGNA